VLVKQLNVAFDAGEQAVAQWQDWVLNDVGIDWQGKRYTYQDLCLQCETKLVPSPIHETQSTLTMYLRPPAPDMPTLSYLSHINRLPPFSPAGSNTTFRLLPDASNTWSFLPSLDGAGLFTGIGDSAQSEKEEQDGLAGLRNVRWFAYAARAFVMRFWTLAKVSCLIIQQDPPAGLQELTARMPILPTFLSSCSATSSCTLALSISSSTCALWALPSGSVRLVASSVILSAND
jgi:hypothetical protein